MEKARFSCSPSPLTDLDQDKKSLSMRERRLSKRRRPDSNRGITDLQSAALDHLATAPCLLDC